MEDIKKSITRIETKLDVIVEDQSQIKITQAEQAKDLKYHIMRTDLSESRISIVEERLLPLVELKHRFDGMFQLLGKVGAGLGLLFAAVKSIETLIHFIK